MGSSLLCSRINFLVFLLALSSQCKLLVQSQMDFGPFKLIQPTNSSSIDFGRMYFNSPSSVLIPNSSNEISLLLSNISNGNDSSITVAAKGAGHSISGQAQALNGIVIEMNSLPSSIKIHKRQVGEKGSSDYISYVDVSGGTLWIELLEETLKEGLTPRSWTDYLYLSIGGTLSNAGIGGQTFKYGPQISNVLQLDVITGKGELVTCSPSNNSELFYATLGGLGQFGVITSARILLQKAPKRLKWVRAFYDDFEKFTKDQEMLVVSMSKMVDYVEGFLILDKDSLQNSFGSFPAKVEPIISKLYSPGTSKIYFCIDFVVYDVSHKGVNLDTVVEGVAKKMKYMPSLLYNEEIPYFDFINRVRGEEMKLREIGLWDVPHPWLNMFVPNAQISKVKDLILKTISTPFDGLLIIYPFLKDKWDSNMSAVLPESDISGKNGNVIYTIGMLRMANPKTCSKQCLEGYLWENNQISTTLTKELGGKLYLTHYNTQEGWKEHFGRKWEKLLTRKSEFDPLNLLAPGQSIFMRKASSN